MKKWNVIFILCCFAMIGFLISCATTKQQLLRTNKSYNEVFKACMLAVADVNYSISSSDSKSGLIVAEQPLVGNSAKVVRLNIMVNRVSNRTEVNVNWVPPPGAVGGSGVLDKYIAALKKRVPNIQVGEN